MHPAMRSGPRRQPLQLALRLRLKRVRVPWDVAPRSQPRAPLARLPVCEQLPWRFLFTLVTAASPGGTILFTARETEAQGGKVPWLKSPDSLPRAMPAHQAPTTLLTPPFTEILNLGLGGGARRGWQSTRPPSEARLSFLLCARTPGGHESHIVTPSWICSLGRKAQSRQGVGQRPRG